MQYTAAAKKPFNLVEAVKRRMMMDPLVFICACHATRTLPISVTSNRAWPPLHAVLGLTVASLARGFGAMAQSDARMSQLMMRSRVFFQLCTVGAFFGGLHYRGELPRFVGLEPWTPPSNPAPPADDLAAGASSAEVELK